MIKTTYVCDLCLKEHDSTRIPVHFRLQSSNSNINHAYTHLCSNCVTSALFWIKNCKVLRKGDKNEENL